MNSEQREAAEQAQLAALAAEFPAYTVRRILGGFVASPVGAIVVLATDLDGITEKLRAATRKGTEQ